MGGAGIFTLAALYTCIIVLGVVIACFKVGDVQPRSYWSHQMVRNVVCLLGQVSVDGKSSFAKQRPKSLRVASQLCQLMRCMLRLGASLCAQACILTQCAHDVLVHSNNASLHCADY